jgi:hypothetical protein
MGEWMLRSTHFCPRWRRVTFTPLPLCHRYPFDRMVCGSQSRCCQLEIKNLFPLGARTPTPSAVQCVATRYRDYTLSVPITVFFYNPILFASYTCTFSKWCKSIKKIKKRRREEECSVAHLQIQQVQGLVCPQGTRLTSYNLRTKDYN